VGVAVGVVVAVGVCVAVAVGVAVGVAVRVGMLVGVCVTVAVGVDVGASVGLASAHAVNKTVSARLTMLVDLCNLIWERGMNGPPGTVGTGGFKVQSDGRGCRVHAGSALSEPSSGSTKIVLAKLRAMDRWVSSINRSWL
jgi:hypothetical protein